MYQDAHNAYLESRILSADPIELLRLLCQACTSSVRDARRHLASGDIAARSRSITKAYDILAELTFALDHKRGGEISQRLGQLYDYMMRKLTEANFQQSDPPLAEVLGLLSTLSEGWDGIQQQSRTSQGAGSPWANTMPQESAVPCQSQAWSF